MGWRYLIFTPVAAVVLHIASASAWALELTLPERAFQGDMIVGKVDPASDIWSGSKALSVSRDGYFVIGVPRDQKSDVVVLAKKGDERIKRTIRIMAQKWLIERINGLPEKTVSPDPETLRRIKEDNLRVATVRTSFLSSPALFVDKGFVMPLKGRISGVFGSQRVLNGEPRSPHPGLDIAAPGGTPIVSPGDGIVRLTANEMVLMGNTLIVDHGLGVSSIFIHLNRILVKEGDIVSQGDVIAQVGQTGRSTGPHLHWGVYVGTIAVDPQRIVPRR
ncbi:MAG: M23 family metallopeptidase [Desulfobacteraceae bacterium]|nr:M23 family metallopeptidase [Desulfobacteraceae bacterium]